MRHLLAAGALLLLNGCVLTTRKAYQATVDQAFEAGQEKGARDIEAQCMGALELMSIRYQLAERAYYACKRDRP